MADLPILFSAPMVLALLAGTKTQTRRVAKVKPGVLLPDISQWADAGEGRARAVFARDQIADPRVAVGDRLYVRETFGNAAMSGYDPVWFYRADPETALPPGFKWKPAIHMPRVASRITLTVTDVRVQRLQEISEDDAIAEGLTPTHLADGGHGWSAGDFAATHDPRDAFRDLWGRINGSGSLDANPWCAAYSFTIALGNIDQIGGAP